MAASDCPENAQLKESYQLLEGALKYTPTMVAHLDPQFNFIWVNRVYADTCRHEPSFFPGKNHFDLYPHEENQAIFQRVVDTGEPFFMAAKPFDFPDQPERGVTYWDWSLVPIIDENKKVASLVFTLAEASDRLKAAEVLRESEERLRLFIEHAPAALAMFDRDMRYLSTSRRWLSDYNLGERDLRGLSHYKVFPEVSEQLKDIHRRALAGEVVRGDAGRFERHDGSVQWMRWEVRPWFDGRGNIGGNVIFSEDITEKKLSEEALRMSGERHRMILQTAQDGFWLIGKKGQILEVNDAYCRMSGYSEAELLKLHISDLDASETKEEVEDHLKKLKSLGQRSLESTHKRKDGSIFDVEVSAQFQPVGEAEFVVFIRDITTRKRADEERQINIEVLQMINESESWETLLKSLLGRLKTWAKCEAVGFRIKEGKDFPYFITSGFSDEFVQMENHLFTYDEDGNLKCDPEGKPIPECICGNIISGKYDPSKTFFTADGCFRSSCMTEFMAAATDTDRVTRIPNRCNAVGYESVALIPLRSGNETFGLIQFCDRQKGRFTPETVSVFARIAQHIASFIAKKHAETSLRKSEQKFRLFTETIDDVVWMRTRGIEKMIYISKAYETIWEKSLESIYNSPESFTDGVHPDDLNILKNAITNFHANGLPYDCEYRIIRGDGDIRWIHERGFPVSESYDGEMVMTGVCSDITDRKHAEQEKKQLERQFVQAQKLETIGRLAGGVAHDFNNLLMIQIGYCELIENRLRDADPLLENIRQIKNCADRAADLTKQLLAFSRKQTLLPKVLDLNTVIKGIEKMINRLIGEDIDISLSLADDLWRVKADQGQIEQVIMNLAVNSRDAMPHGGKLSVETANVFLDETYALGHQGAKSGPHVMLAISDTGCGMNEDTKNKLFEPFFTTKGKGKGTGLGLATVYGIIKQSGGNIYVYSEPEKGAIFKIYLPRVEAELTESISQEVEIVYGKGELVLLVEDEPILRKIFVQMIKELGYDVEAAANGGEALLMIEEEGLKPDLLITDVVMPGMSGKTLVERLDRTQSEKMKVIYISGYMDDTIVQHGLTDSGISFLQKPFNKNDLAKVIRSVLDS